MTADRKQMRRLGAGDYLLRSNDALWVWRLHTHRDGSDHGTDAPYRDREFWRAVRMPMEMWLRGKYRMSTIPNPWEAPWEEVDWFLPTRAAALALVNP